jgi:hypothetical protein
LLFYVKIAICPPFYIEIGLHTKNSFGIMQSTLIISKELDNAERYEEGRPKDGELRKNAV